MSIIALPFKIVKKLGWVIIWHTVYLFLRKPKLLLVLVVVGGGAAMFYFSQPKDPRQIKPPKQPAAQSREVTENQLPALSGKIENGDKIFSTNIFGQMRPEEKQFYSRAFHKAVTYKKAGETHAWMMSSQFFGKIKAGALFQSSGKAECRSFSETIKLRKITQTKTGVACLRADKSGWCVVGKNSVQNCEITRSQGNERWMDKLKSWF